MATISDADLLPIYTRLQELGCYEAWKKYAIAYNRDIADEVICDAFTWDETADGNTYWRVLNNEMGYLPSRLHGIFNGKELAIMLSKFETIPELLLIERAKTWR